MSDITVNTPVAPVQGVQGSSTPGGHYIAFRACAPFQAASTFALVSSVNPWRPATPGHKLWVQVLSQNPGTIGNVLAMAQERLGFKPRETQGHLRWLHTWGGSYMVVDGQRYAAVATPFDKAEFPPLPNTKGKGKKGVK
jgi:hypothetical protein